MFGQIPDVLEDVWVDVAKGKIDEAKRHINEVEGIEHPFDERYSKIQDIDWDSCKTVLSSSDIKDHMMMKW